MDPLIGSALISAGGGALQSIFGLGKNKRNRQMMNYELKQNKKMFDYQNAYNTPKNQINRLKEAGLNPALMYGQGTTGNSIGSAPQTRYTPDESFDSSSLIQGVTQGAQMLLQKQQVNNLKAQQQETESRTLLNTIDATVKGGTKEEAKGLIKYQLENLKSDNKNKLQNLANSKVTNDILNKDLSKKQIEIENAQIEKALNQSDLDYVLKSGLSRQEPALIKLIWRAAQKVPEVFRKLIIEIYGEPNIWGGFNKFKN